MRDIEDFNNYDLSDVIRYMKKYVDITIDDAMEGKRFCRKKIPDELEGDFYFRLKRNQGWILNGNTLNQISFYQQSVGMLLIH